MQFCSTIVQKFAYTDGVGVPKKTILLSAFNKNFAKKTIGSAEKYQCYS